MTDSIHILGKRDYLVYPTTTSHRMDFPKQGNISVTVILTQI